MTTKLPSLHLKPLFVGFIIFFWQKETPWLYRLSPVLSLPRDKQDFLEKFDAKKWQQSWLLSPETTFFWFYYFVLTKRNPWLCRLSHVLSLPEDKQDLFEKFDAKKWQQSWLLSPETTFFWFYNFFLTKRNLIMQTFSCAFSGFIWKVWRQKMTTKLAFLHLKPLFFAFINFFCQKDTPRLCRLLSFLYHKTQDSLGKFDGKKWKQCCLFCAWNHFFLVLLKCCDKNLTKKNPLIMQTFSCAFFATRHAGFTWKVWHTKKNKACILHLKPLFFGFINFFWQKEISLNVKAFCDFSCNKTSKIYWRHKKQIALLRRKPLFLVL